MEDPSPQPKILGIFDPFPRFPLQKKDEKAEFGGGARARSWRRFPCFQCMTDSRLSDLLCCALLSSGGREGAAELRPFLRCHWHRRRWHCWQCCQHQGDATPPHFDSRSERRRSNPLPGSHHLEVFPFRSHPGKPNQRKATS